MLKNIRKVIKYPSLFPFFIFNLFENNNSFCIENNGEGSFIRKFLDYHRVEKSKGALVIFDLGAARGEYFQKILDLSGELQIQIHAFEPSIYSYRKLIKKYEDERRVTLNNFAVSNKKGGGYLHYDKQGSPHASLIKRSDLVVNMTKRSRVKKIVLKEYIKKNEIDHIHLLKMDIEGSELDALEGMGKYLNSDFVDLIQFEYGGANLDSRTSLQDFYNIFNKKGFCVSKILRNRLQIRKYHQWMDNFQMSNYVAISKNISSEVDTFLS